MSEPRSADQWYSAMKTWTRDRNRLIARAERAESQNQALQEERDLLQSRLSGQTKLTGMLQERAARAEKAEALIRAWDDLPAQVTDLTEMLNDADADKRALQERAEKAEKELGSVINHFARFWWLAQHELPTLETELQTVGKRAERILLSPTQETDPE